MKYVIAGGDVVDGAGTPAQQCDVFVTGGVIAGVRPAKDHHAGWHVFDATGLTIVPGFIDVHSHGDNVPWQ